MTDGSQNSESFKCICFAIGSDKHVHVMRIQSYTQPALAVCTGAFVSTCVRVCLCICVYVLRMQLNKS